MRAVSLAAVLAVAITLGSSAAACARMGTGAPPLPVVQGRIIDLKPEWMMLSDGTQIIVPPSVVRWNELTLGAVVRVQYEEREGKKVATSMNYLEGFPGQRGL
ncbi:MAG TPA: hypothetical protein VMI34_07115 [Candidatus Bathyarchaeia archaeon]|nr:hypothetical protein [Candidatus Bathyarchaeia archaeon]